MTLALMTWARYKHLKMIINISPCWLITCERSGQDNGASISNNAGRESAGQWEISSEILGQYKP